MKRFKAIPEFPDYIASVDGKIIRLSRGSGPAKPGKEISSKLHKDGYFKVNLWKNGKSYTRYVHGLIASAFLGKKPKGLETDHIDGNRQNNIASNLRYLTRKENALHGLELHRTVKSYAKLTVDQVKRIKKLIVNGLSDTEISKSFDVGRTAIKEIRAERNWKWVKIDVELSSK